MDFSVEDAAAWSAAVFGSVDLGDKRLTKRLIQIGKQLSSLPGCSLSASCEGQEVLLEGSYRFLRNKRISATHIANGGYQVTSLLSQSIPTLLVIEDTTTLSYSHQVKEVLGDLGGHKEKSSRGFHVHTTLLMDAENEKTIGLIAQNRWCRAVEERGKKVHRRVRQYSEKESYQWEKNTLELESRLGTKMTDVISVCDREADIFEYIQYKLDHEKRFIVRASHNRKLEQGEGYLFQHLSNATALGNYTIEVAQKKGRKKRQVMLELKALTVTFSPADRRAKDRQLKPITVNLVIAKEQGSIENEALEWILLTSEPVTSFACARKVTRYYEMRWRIEDFHKAWKSGARVEEQRMQSIDHLEKMIVILSFVAIRLLQLKEYFEYPTTLKMDDAISCCE